MARPSIFDWTSEARSTPSETWRGSTIICVRPKLSQRELGDGRRLGRIAAFMTQTLAVIGDHAAAVESGQRALNIATTHGDLGLRVIANYFLHQSYYFSGEYRQAINGLQWYIASLEGRSAPRALRLIQVSRHRLASRSRNLFGRTG
jgi:hypothetical protein